MRLADFTGYLKRTAGGARLLGVALTVLVAAGCATYASGIASRFLPARGEMSRGQFVAQVSDYLGWYHASTYNDYWKVPLRTFADVKASDR